MNSNVVVPAEVFRLAVESNMFFQRLNGDTAEMHARDVLNLERPFKHAQTLERYARLRGAKVLEIGSGFGANMSVWIKDLQADMYGIEPSAPEWGNSFKASRLLLAANGIAPDRVINGVAESLPFDDKTFDIVYSANLLEHVHDPQDVLEESIRVLRPNGILHFEVPNFASYYESHYSILQPPALTHAILRSWVRIRGKDPTFVDSLNLINPVWCRRALRRIKDGRIRLLTLGEEIFLERLKQQWEFETEQPVGNVSKLVVWAQRLNVGNWIGRAIVAAQGFYPIYLTVRKEA